MYTSFCFSIAPKTKIPKYYTTDLLQVAIFIIHKIPSLIKEVVINANQLKHEQSNHMALNNHIVHLLPQCHN